MIIQNYILREIGLTLLAVMTVLLLIFFSTRFVNILGDVAAGTLPGEVLFSLLGLKLIKNLSAMMPLAVFFSVLLAFGRLYRDREMVALAASGVGQMGIVRIVLVLAPAIFVINAGLSLFVTPWAEGKANQIKHAADNRSELSLLAAGRFTESSEGNLLMYVERLSDDQRQLENVFVQNRGSARKGILASEHGYRYTDPDSGDDYMVMIDGYRYEGEPGEADFRITKFRKHAVRIKEKQAPEARIRRDAKPNSVLWESDLLKDTAELQWRLVLPLTTVALMLLAIPLSRVNPREGRYGRFFSAVFIYVIYNNMFGAAYNWVGKGSLSPWIGMWWIPLAILLVAIVIAAWQGRGQVSWFDEWRANRRTKAIA